ncbi:MAG: DinB family protein [Bacteroidota bacterium]|nr:DinB family protein [Bacteroidota bacterium]
MELKQYLIDTFQFNDHANKMILSKIKELPEKKESIRFFSHLINSQIKWLKRIQVYPNDPHLDWWEPAYPLEELESRWNNSLSEWINFLENNTEESLYEERKFIGFDGSVFSAPLKDIALQLNYHSIHHRAQIQTIIRQQGLQPDFIDYIGTKYKKLS